MRILLVCPQFPVTYWGFQYSLHLAGHRVILPPLGLVTMASYLPGDWNLELVDLNIRPVSDGEIRRADAVLTGGMRIQSESMHQLITRCRRLGVRCAVGGPAPTTAPHEYKDADIVFTGEIEGREASLIDAVGSPAGGRILLEAGADRWPEMTEARIPRFDLYDFKHYSSMSIQYSRGCPFRCEFCDIIEIYGRRPRVKSPDQVIAELDALLALGFEGPLFIVDDNFIGHRPAVRELLSHLTAYQEERGFPFEFFTEASVDLALDQALYTSMVDAGFSSVFLGIETPSEASLKETGKTQNLRLDPQEGVRRLTVAGLEVMAGFIVGFDCDDVTVFDLQRDFIMSSPIPLSMVGLLTALPGTRLTRRLEAEGRLRDGSGGDQFDRPNFETSMDEHDLLSGYASLMKTIYSPESYYDRVDRLIQMAPPVPGRRRGRLRDWMTLMRTVIGSGIKGPARRFFWRTLERTVVGARHAIPAAIAHAIKGEHLIRYTSEVVLPRIERALKGIARQRHMLAEYEGQYAV